MVGKFATILDPLREDNWGEKETRVGGVCAVGNEGEKVEKRSWLRVFFPMTGFQTVEKISLSKHPLPGIIDWAMTL